MNILMLNHNFVEQGTYFRCYHFARHLAKKGHDVVLFTRSRSSRFFPKVYYKANVKIFEMPKGILGRLHHGNWPELDILYRLFYILTKRFDVIFAFSHRPNVAIPFYISGLLKKRSIYISDWDDLWCKGGILGYSGRLDYKINSFFEEDIRRRADGVVTTSSFLYDLAREFGIRQERLRHIPSGANVDSIKPLLKKEARNTLGMPIDCRILEYISSGIGPETNIVLRIFSEIIKYRKDTILLLVGVKGITPLEFIQKSKVIETGPVPYDEIGIYLSCADIFLLPFSESINSKARGPIKLGDYMAAGRPTIANEVGDTAKYFTNDRIGLLARADGSDFLSKIIFLLDNPKLCEELGRNARKAAEEKYSWSTMTSKLEEFIMELSKKKLKDKG